MQRLRRISMGGRKSKKLSNVLRELGVDLPKPTSLPGGSDFTVFVVAESHPNFAAVLQLAKDNDLFVLEEVKFDHRDYAAATHVTLYGMPKTYPCTPRGGFPNGSNTYDLSDACGACGTGRRQINSFRLEKEVKVKEREVIGIHWIFDEIFMSPWLAAEVFEKIDVPTRDVLNCSGRRVFPGVRQGIIPEVFVPVDTAGLAMAKCPSCEREKFEPRPGLFPRLMERTDAPIFRTAQYFGSGGQAYRQIIVKRTVYDDLIAAGTKSLIADPVAAA